MDMSKVDGLAWLQGIVSGAYPQPPIGETMGIRLIHVEEGVARFSGRAGISHTNPMGGVHGGFAATVLDSVTGCAVHSMLAAGDFYGTVDLSVKMLRPVPLDQDLIAEGRMINISRSLGVSEGDLRDANGKLLAHATCTCLIKRAA